jgi:ribosomal protein L21E
MEEFENGDLVIIKNYGPIFNGEIGVVIGTSGIGSKLVKFDKKFAGNVQHTGHNGEDPSGRSRYFPIKFLLSTSDEEYKKRQQEKLNKQLKNIEKYGHIDPYGEDEWENESNTYIMEDFEDGDIVSIKDYTYDTSFNGRVGVIIGTSDSGTKLVKFDEIYDASMQHSGHNGEDPSRRSRYFHIRYLVHHLSDEEYQKIKEEKLSKQLKNIEKYGHIDPYGEDEWENESNTYDELKKGDLVIVQNYKFPVFNDKVGVIIGINRTDIKLVKFGEIYDSELQFCGDDYEDLTSRSRYINDKFLNRISPSEYKKREEEIRKEIEAAKQEKIDRYREIDPLGEEDWENESRILKFNNFVNEKLGRIN